MVMPAFGGQGFRDGTSDNGEGRGYRQCVGTPPVFAIKSDLNVETSDHSQQLGRLGGSVIPPPEVGY